MGNVVLEGRFSGEDRSIDHRYQEEPELFTEHKLEMKPNKL